MYPSNSQFLKVLSNTGLQGGNFDFTVGAWVFLNKNNIPAMIIRCGE